MRGKDVSEQAVRRQGEGVSEIMAKVISLQDWRKG